MRDGSWKELFDEDPDAPAQHMSLESSNGTKGDGSKVEQQQQQQQDDQSGTDEEEGGAANVGGDNKGGDKGGNKRKRGGKGPLDAFVDGKRKTRKSKA